MSKRKRSLAAKLYKLPFPNDRLEAEKKKVEIEKAKRTAPCEAMSSALIGLSAGLRSKLESAF